MLDTFNTAGIALVTFLVTGSVVYAMGQKRRKVFDSGKQLMNPPCLKALPIVGSLPFFPKNLNLLPEFFMKKADEYGPIFFFYAGRQLGLVINGKSAIVNALVKHSEAFADRPDVWTEANILNVELRGFSFSHYHETYKRNRKIAMSIMKEFGFGDFRKMSKLIMDEIQEMTDEILKQNSRAFDPKSTLITFTSNVVLSILFGKQFQSIGDNHQVIIETSNQILENIDTVIDMAPIIRHLPRFRKRIEKMVSSQEELMKRLEIAIDFSRTCSSEETFVKRYIEIIGSNYDHTDFLYMLRDLSMGSTATVATSTMWALVELANHPQILERIQKEIDEAIPEDRFPSLEDKPLLPYTEATMLEVWRRRMLTPFLGPHATTKDTEVDGYFIPKGCLVLPNLYSVHMDARTWNDPESFRPERFLDENGEVFMRDMIMPFAVGKRSCIGEMIARPKFFLFLASIAQCFDIYPPEGKSSIQVTEDFGLIVSPGAFEIRFIPRRRKQS